MVSIITDQVTQPRKRLVHEVKLRFFEDEANGEWGLAHESTYQGEGGNDGFNAFWDARGLFHDVFEHWFENRHKRFMGDAALNVGGEMAAMGALWYYYDELGLHDRQFPGQIHYMGDTMRRGTQDLVTEAISEGYCQFGDELVSHLPRQRPTDNSELECQIDLLMQEVRKASRRAGFNGPQSSTMEAAETQEQEYGRAYKASVTKRKVADLHRWGYRMAGKLVPNTHDNRYTLQSFLAYWEAFTKANSAEDLGKVARGMTIKVYRRGDAISWVADLNLMHGAKRSTYRLPDECPKWSISEDLYSLFD